MEDRAGHNQPPDMTATAGDTMKPRERGRSILERLEFYSIPIPECGCRIWLGGLTRGGYGVITINRRCVRTHRAMWIEHNGPIPKNMLVLHTCDTPACINPNHLFLGTTKTNILDKVLKKRTPSGIKHHNNKLTEKEVIEIRSSTESQSKIALKYNIDQAHVSQIKLRKRWKHLP
jgi:hypothetical protein